MRRWFLSYNSQDLALMQAFEAALRRKDAEAHIFFAPKSLPTSLLVKTKPMAHGGIIPPAQAPSPPH